MFFKDVEPVNAFCNGKQVTVEKVNVQSIYDNLFDEVKFKYTLADKDGVYAGEGAFILTPDRYKQWDASAEGAYQLVCAGIGLELK
jgi:hypothetical protein